MRSKNSKYYLKIKRRYNCSKKYLNLVNLQYFSKFQEN